MQPISPERYYAAIEAAAGTLAGLVQDADLTRPVPTCPDWTLRQLATHVGRTHRWVAEIVTARSAELIPLRSVPYGRFPDDPAEHAAWLTAGAHRVVEAVRSAGETQVWAFGSIAPASFWARRMTHETAVHTADAELAAGLPAQIAPDIAADAIDEWLSLLSGPRYHPEHPAGQALPEGRVLHVHATDTGPGGTGEWLVSGTASGLTVRGEHGRGDVALAGPASRLLLVLVRRLPPDDPEIKVHGDAGLLGQWLAKTPF